jgi:hypothetical protein
MRACARLVLVSLAMSATLGLAGCDSIDRLTDTMTGLFDTKKKLPGERKAVFPEGVPGVTQGVPSEYLPAKKAPGEETSESAAQDGESPAGKKAAETPSEKKDRPARKPQRPQTAEAPKKPTTPAPAEPVQPQAGEPPSAPAQASPSQLPWPAAPPPGTFSR